MATHEVKVTQINKGVNPVIHVVQGDSNRSIVAKITDVSITGTASMSFERPDGTVYTASATINTTDNTVTADLTSDMLNVVGNAKATFRVTSSNKVISTFLLYVAVEPSAGFGQTPSSASNKIYVYVNGSAVEIAKQADLASLTSRVTTNEANISTINNDLFDIRDNIYTLSNDEIIYEMGNLNTTTGRVGDSTKQVRTAEWIYAKRGSIFDIQTGYKYKVLRYSSPSVADYIGATSYQDGQYILPSDCYVKFFLSALTPVVTDVTIADNMMVSIVTKNKFEDIDENLQKVKSEIDDNNESIYKLKNEVFNLEEKTETFEIGGIISTTGRNFAETNNKYVRTTGFVELKENSEIRIDNGYMCTITYHSTAQYATWYKGNDNVKGSVSIDNDCYVRLAISTENLTPQTDTSISSHVHILGCAGNDKATTNYFKRDSDYSTPYVVFVDDDGHRDFANLKTLMDSKGKKCTLAVVNDWVGYSTHLPVSTLCQYRDSGYDVISHTKSHAVNIYGNNVGTSAWHNFATVDDDTIYTDLKQAHDYCVKYGFNADGLAWPWGHYPQTYDVQSNNPDPDDAYVCGADDQQARYARLARQAGFKYALNSIGGLVSGTGKFNQMWLNRQEVVESNGIATYQNMINVAKSQGGICIFMTHSYDEGIASMNFIGQLIDYADSVGVEVVTLKKAMEEHHHVVSIGDYGDKYTQYVIRANGLLIK